MKLEGKVTNIPSACFEVLDPLSSMSATVFLLRRENYAQRCRVSEIWISVTVRQRHHGLLVAHGILCR
jgi:hypothetical protein